MVKLANAFSDKSMNCWILDFANIKSKIERITPLKFI